MGVFEQFPYTNTHDLNLDWVLRTIKEQIANFELLSSAIDEKINAQNAKIEEYENQLILAIQKYESELQKIKDGKYLEDYINKNLQDFVAKIAKFVFFKLDNEGFFIADIPNSWEFLQFKTIVDPESEDYGKLILTY